MGAGLYLHGRSVGRGRSGEGSSPWVHYRLSVPAPTQTRSLSPVIIPGLPARSPPSAREPLERSRCPARPFPFSGGGLAPLPVPPPEAAARTHCPRRSAVEGSGFLVCPGRGGGAQVCASGGRVSGGSERHGNLGRPGAEQSPGPRPAMGQGGPRWRRGRAGGRALLPAPLSG